MVFETFKLSLFGHARIQRGGGGGGSGPLPPRFVRGGFFVDVTWVGEGVPGLFLSYYNIFPCINLVHVWKIFITSKFKGSSLFQDRHTQDPWLSSLGFMKVHFRVYCV